MGNWLKIVGMGEHGQPVVQDWRTHTAGERGGKYALGNYVMFPSQPRKISRGDGIVLYAAGHKVILATGVALSNPYPPGSGTSPKYPWIVDVAWDEESSVPFVRYGLPLSTIGVDGKSVRQQSHIALSDEQYRTASRVLKRAKAELEEAKA